MGTGKEKIFHYVFNNLNADEVKTINITDEQRADVDYKAFNFLVVYNGTANLLLVQLNKDSNQRIPLPASGGRVTINKEDVITFSDVQIVEATSGAAVGSVYVTVGVLGV